MKLSRVIDDYLSHKRHGIRPATLDAYTTYADQILRHLGDHPLRELPGEIPGWIDKEIARLGGRTHTVVKRIEAILKPAIRHAYARFGLAVPWVFPEVRSDYHAVQIRKGKFLSREQYAALRMEMPEVDEIEFNDGRGSIRCYPRARVDLAVTTGLHGSDLDAFQAGYIDRTAGTWWRNNTNNAEHYQAEALPLTAFMRGVLCKHLDRYRLSGDDLFTVDLRAEEPRPPENWMRRRLMWAAHRIGMCKLKREGQKTVLVDGWYPAEIDLRRTCAEWNRADGWTEAQTAKWLANSAGIVASVYAPTPKSEMRHAVARSAASSHRMLRITEQLSKTPRRGAVPSRGQGTKSLQRSGNRSKTANQRSVRHGKQTLR